MPRLKKEEKERIEKLHFVKMDKLWYANQLEQLAKAEDEILTFGTDNQMKGVKRLHTHLKMLKAELAKNA